MLAVTANSFQALIFISPIKETPLSPRKSNNRRGGLSPNNSWDSPPPNTKWFPSGQQRHKDNQDSRHPVGIWDILQAGLARLAYFPTHLNSMNTINGGDVETCRQTKKESKKNLSSFSSVLIPADLTLHSHRTTSWRHCLQIILISKELFFSPVVLTEPEFPRQFLLLTAACATFIPVTVSGALKPLTLCLICRKRISQKQHLCLLSMKHV